MSKEYVIPDHIQLAVAGQVANSIPLFISAVMFKELISNKPEGYVDEVMDKWQQSMTASIKQALEVYLADDPDFAEASNKLIAECIKTSRENFIKELDGVY